MPPKTQPRSRKTQQRRRYKKRQVANSNSNMQQVVGQSKFNKQPRTPTTIINALASKMQRARIMSPYETVRTTCMAFKAVPSIPDGASGRHVCMCLYTLDRMAFSSASSPVTAHLQVNPWYPYIGSLYSLSNSLIVNGQTYVAQSTVPMGINATFQGLGSVATTRPGSNALANDPYTATSMRIISQTHRIAYTGPVSSCSGMLRGFGNNLMLQDYGQTNATASGTTPPSTGISFSNTLGYSIGGVNAPVNTLVLGFDGTLVPAAPSGTNSVRPEHGMLLRLKHKSDRFQNVPIMTNFMGVTQTVASNEGSGSVLNYYNIVAETGNFGAGLSAYDNDWEGMHVIFDNVNPDASFSIETCMCVELTLNTTSPFVPLSKESSRPQPAEIARVERILAEEGSAISM